MRSNELERDGARRGQVAAVMVEGGAHVGGGAVAVVGQRLAENADTCRAVALVGDRLVVGRVLARAERLVDSGLDLVLRQRVALGLFDCRCKGGVVLGIRVATLLGCYGDVTRQLGEQRRTLGVLRRLAMLGGRPF